jgi:transposase
MSTDAHPSPDLCTPLPDDPVVLQRMVHELLATLAETRRHAEQVEHRLDQLLRRLYGPRAERYDPNQPVLFEMPTPPAPEDVALPPAEESEASPRRAPHGRRRLPRNLRRERRVYALTESERLCPGCGQPRAKIGEETSEQLDYQPASLYVIEHVRAKYACPHCAEHVALAAKPPSAIAKGLPGPGLLAQVVVSKTVDHLPLHRQERIFARHGVLLHRSTTCGWMAACAQLLRPLSDLMRAQILHSKVIHTDDSPIPVLDANRDAARRGHMWVYLGDRDHPYTIFDFTPNHTQDGPKNFLGDFQGYLQADAYKGYEALYASGRILEVACWAHTRRYFFEAKNTDAERAHAALAWIRRLYDVEDPCRDLSDADRAAYRQEHARPILGDFAAWLRAQQVAVLPKSPMGQAIAYALSNWDALVRYTEAGFLAIDNNVSERTLRDFVIGRKNWLFAGSDQGGRTAAVLFSFAATCRRLKVEPFAYLRDLFDRLPTHPADRLDDLLPHRWAARPPPNP